MRLTFKEFTLSHDDFLQGINLGEAVVAIGLPLRLESVARVEFWGLTIVSGGHVDFAHDGYHAGYGYMIFDDVVECSLLLHPYDNERGFLKNGDGSDVVLRRRWRRQAPDLTQVLYGMNVVLWWPHADCDLRITASPKFRLGLDPEAVVPLKAYTSDPDRYAWPRGDWLGVGGAAGSAGETERR